MKRNSGFTVIELLVVVGIIGILIGIVGTSAFIARSQAYETQAKAETQELVAAVKAIWISREDQKLPIPEGTVKMTAANVEKFNIQDESGMRNYLEIPSSRLSEGGYLDPWGNEYEYTLGREDTENNTVSEEVYQIAVSFQNNEIFYFKDDKYTEDDN